MSRYKTVVYPCLIKEVEVKTIERFEKQGKMTKNTAAQMKTLVRILTDH